MFRILFIIGIAYGLALIGCPVWLAIILGVIAMCIRPK